MRRLLSIAAVGIVLVALATDGFPQQPPAPAPTGKPVQFIQIDGQMNGLALPTGAVQFQIAESGPGQGFDKGGRRGDGGGGRGSIQFGGIQMGGGSPGGFGGGGRGGFGGSGRSGMMGGDPNQIFNMLSKGKDVINRNELQGWQQQMFDRMAPQFGITNNQISRAQFLQISEQMRSRMQQRGGPGGGGGMSPEQMDRFSEMRFRRSDTDNDGLLKVNEMPESLRQVWEKFDTNKDGAIDLNEFKGYMHSVFQQREQPNNGSPTPGQPGQEPLVIPHIDFGQPPSDDEEEKPIVYRAGKLPKDIPGWFEQLDFDKDGQIGLYEWVRGGRSVEEFQGLDRNEDGLLTIEEVISYVRQESKPGTGSQGEAQMAATGAPNGANGNGMMMGFGGGPGMGGFGGRGPGMWNRGGNNGGGFPMQFNFTRGGDNGGGPSFGGRGGRRGGGEGVPGGFRGRGGESAGFRGRGGDMGAGPNIGKARDKDTSSNDKGRERRNRSGGYGYGNE